MGRFPHSAPRSVTSAANPAGTDGFAFVEFAHPEPARLRETFRRMGCGLTARHRSRAIELLQQGAITFVLNEAPGSHARRFVDDHGPFAPSVGWRMRCRRRPRPKPARTACWTCRPRSASADR